MVMWMKKIRRRIGDHFKRIWKTTFMLWVTHIWKTMGRAMKATFIFWEPRPNRQHWYNRRFSQRWQAMKDKWNELRIKYALWRRVVLGKDDPRHWWQHVWYFVLAVYSYCCWKWNNLWAMQLLFVVEGARVQLGESFCLRSWVLWWNEWSRRWRKCDKEHKKPFRKAS